MTARQVIWLRADATTFTGLCDLCLAHAEAAPQPPLSYRAAKVVGRLHSDADVGFTRCDRGHPISVRRVGRTAA